MSAVGDGEVGAELEIHCVFLSFCLSGTLAVFVAVWNLTVMAHGGEFGAALAGDLGAWRLLTGPLGAWMMHGVVFGLSVLAVLSARGREDGGRENGGRENGVRDDGGVARRWHAGRWHAGRLGWSVLWGLLMVRFFLLLLTTAWAGAGEGRDLSADGWTVLCLTLWLGAVIEGLGLAWIGEREGIAWWRAAGLVVNRYRRKEGRR